MLYVSRLLGYGQAGVVDTDDGVEEIVYYDNLRDLVEDGSLVVEGLSLYQPAGTLNTKLVVAPYQDPATVTRLQSKMSVLNHVNISVWNGMVTAVTFNHTAISTPVDIVLSDFGHVIADRIFENCSESAGKHKITLILDDSLSLGLQSLMPQYSSLPLGKYTYGVVTDVSRVTNIDLLCRVYAQLFQGCFRFNGNVLDRGVVDSLIDRPERQQLLMNACKAALDDIILKGIRESKGIKIIESRMKELYLLGGR